MLKIKFMVLKFTHRRRCRGEYLLKFHPAISQLLAAAAAIKFSRNSTFSLGCARGQSEWRRISKRTVAMRSRWSLIRISLSRSINKSFSSVAAYLAFSALLDYNVKSMKMQAVVLQVFRFVSIAESPSQFDCFASEYFRELFVVSLPRLCLLSRSY